MSLLVLKKQACLKRQVINSPRLDYCIFREISRSYHFLPEANHLKAEAKKVISNPANVVVKANFCIDANLFFSEAHRLFVSVVKGLKKLVEPVASVLYEPQKVDLNSVPSPKLTVFSPARLKKILRKILSLIRRGLGKYLALFAILTWLLWQAELLSGKLTGIYVDNVLVTPATETLLSRMIKNSREGNFYEVIKFGRATLILAVIRAFLEYLGLSDKASLTAVTCTMALCFASMKRGYLNDMRLSLFSDLFEADIDWHQIEFNSGLRQFWRLVAIDIVRFIREGSLDNIYADEGNGNYRHLGPSNPNLESDLAALMAALMSMVA